MTSLAPHINADQITDCWVEPGSSDNGNILWVFLGSRAVIVGGYRSLAEAINVGRSLGWEPTIEED